MSLYYRTGNERRVSDLKSMICNIPNNVIIFSYSLESMIQNNLACAHLHLILQNI